MTMAVDPTAFCPSLEWGRARPLAASAISVAIADNREYGHGSAAPWVWRALSSIHELEILDDGWDGGVAAAVDAGAIRAASRYVVVLGDNLASLAPPLVAPTVNGGVTLEWHSADSDVEFEFAGDGEVLVYSMTADGDEYEGPLNSAPVAALAPLYRFGADHSAR